MLRHLLRTTTTPMSRRSALAGAGSFGAAAVAVPALRRPLPAQPPHDSSSGSDMPVGDLPGWRQVLTEDFDADVPIGGFSSTDSGALVQSCAAHDAYADRLRVYPDGWSTWNSMGVYAPERTISTKSSVLDLYLHRDSTSGDALAAAVYPARAGRDDNASTYGRWSWRMRSAAVTSAGWACVSFLWPENADSWPLSGEADWPEGDISGTVSGWNHPKSPLPAQEYIPGAGRLWSDWHTYAIEWLPGSLRYLVDGAEALHVTHAVPNTAMRWLVQTGNYAWAPPGSGHVQIDWVVAYDPA